jgi:hypothetical protein
MLTFHPLKKNLVTSLQILELEMLASNMSNICRPSLTFSLPIANNVHIHNKRKKIKSRNLDFLKKKI